MSEHANYAEKKTFLVVLSTFPTIYYSKLSSSTLFKNGIFFFRNNVTSLQQEQNLDMVQNYNMSRQPLNCDPDDKSSFWLGRKHCGEKSRKCWLPAFSTFSPAIFSKVVFYLDY